MPRSGDAETGLVSQDPNTWRVSLEYSKIFGLMGGHDEHHGLDPTGNLVEIEKHGHRVELDITRFETGISHTFNDTWDVLLRMPYFIKDQETTLDFSSDYPAKDRAAAVRNNEIHHRTESYQGWGDPELLVGWRSTSLLLSGDVVRLSFGVSLPFGRTEEDPYALGDAGQKHLHLQFGSGTVDPIVEAYYGLPLNESVAISLSGRAKISLYENNHGYQAAPEFQLAPSVTYLAGKKFSVTAGGVLFYQDFDHWNGVRGEGSGQTQFTLGLGIGYKFSEVWSMGASVQIPVYSRSRTGGDSLEPGNQISLSLAAKF